VALMDATGLEPAASILEALVNSAYFQNQEIGKRTKTRTDFLRNDDPLSLQEIEGMSVRTYQILVCRSRSVSIWHWALRMAGAAWSTGGVNAP
jgi:hypothetical protein